MAQTVKITPASGLLEFIGNTTTNKPYLQHDDNGNLTLTLQATKKFTVAGNLKINGKVTMAQQTLTDGAAITWDFNSGANAKVTIAGARTLVIANMETGDTGLILVKQDAAGGRTLTLPGGSSIVGGGSYTASSAPNATDVLGVYYDGTTYWWTIGYNTVTPPLTSVGITGSDFVIANSPLTSNGNIGLALATVNSNVGTFGSATAVPVVTVNAKGLVTAVSTTNISIPTNLDSLTDVTISLAATGQLLQFNGSQWVNWTPNYVPTSRTLSINGTSYDLSANRAWTIDTVSYVSRVQHGVKAGVAINKGQAVYVTSADGTNMIVGLASNGSEATSSKTMGLLDATVAINGMANVVTEGLLAGLDTSLAGTEGDPVWLGDNGNLIYGLPNKPYAPRHLVFIGIVTRKNANTGEIFVKVQNGFELKEIHDVDLITTVPVNGHILGYDGTLWVNKTIAGWLGFTPANDANVVHTTGNESIAGIKTFSGTTQATSTTTGTIVTAGGVGIAKNLYVGGDLNVVGNLVIGGTTTTVYAQNLAVSDNMIYLNNGIATTITNAVGNGSSVVYTTQETHNYVIGMSVTITGVSPTAYNLSNQIITGVSTNSFTIANSATGSYSSGGTARAKSNANPDLGFAAGYNDGSYAHAGLFRDATDNTWKFFKGYTPEPDASPFIDTSHASFAYADLRADNITGRSFIKVGGTSSEFLKADGSVDSNTYLTTGTASTTYQPLDGDLTAIAGLTATGFLKRTGTNTWTLDSNVYLTAESDTLASVVGRGATSTAQITVDSVITTNNGNGTNFRIGDDAWIGDINLANTFRIQGAQDPNEAYIVFGEADNTALGRTGPGDLTYGNNVIWHAGNLTNLNQLTNGPGYITSASLSGYVPTSRTLTINGTTYDLSANRTWTITAGVSSVSAGTGISVNSTTGAVTVTNTGLLSATAGTGITVSTSNQNLTINTTALLSATAGTGITVSTSNQNLTINTTALLSATAGTGITVSTSNQNLTINNTGLLSAAAGTGITVSTSNQQVTINNTGLLSAVAGSGISVSTSNQQVTITNTITNNNQLTNGSNYITTNGRAYPRRADGTNINFYWTGQSGQPSWLWGSNNGEDFYVWNPSNFSVAYASEAKWISFDDGPRDLTDRRPNWNNRSVAWDFVTAGTADGVGNYAGVMTFSPWDGTSASTGDSSYQLAFINETGLNASGVPGLRLRNGIDSTWNDWYQVWHSGNFTNNSSNWNTAYSKRPTALAFSGTGTKTLTLTLGDSSTLTASFSDIDTDTNTDAQTLTLNGSTLSISGGNSITLPTSGISQGTADSLYVNISGDEMTGNLYVSPISGVPQIQLAGTNPEFYVSARSGTARAFINRAGSGNQATLMFTTGMNVSQGTAWDYTGVPMWTLGMTNNNNTDSFKIAYGDIYDPGSVSLEITSANVAYFTYVPYAAGNLLATQAWVTSQGYLTALPSHNHDDRYYTESESDSRFAAISHNHTSLTGITSLAFSAQASDAGSITTTISGTSTYFDFNLLDDNSNDEWRWRFTPSGASVYDAMRLVPVTNTTSNLIVSGTITSSGGNSGNWNTAYGWGNHASSGYIVAGSTISDTGSWTNATKFKSSGDISNAGAGNHSLQIFSDTNNDAFIAFHISGDYAVYFGVDDATNRLHTGGWSEGAAKYQLWDSRDFSSTNISNWNTAYGWGNHAGLYASSSHTHTFASLTSKPTTISGYGITDAITTGNIGSQSVNYSTYAAYVENDSYYMRFHWSGQSGQPTWLWGGNEGENMYVYDPSNFSVNYANSAGSVAWGNITGVPSTFTPASHTHDDRYYTESESDSRFLRGTTDPSTPGNFTLSIGNNGSYSYIQSHSGQPLRLNPVGNAVFVDSTLTVSGDVTGNNLNISNWNTAYNKRPTAIAFSGTGTKTLTLTQGDGSTLTASFSDIDTDTNTDAQTLTLNGSTLSISGGNSITLPSGGISQATADSLYVNVSGDTMTGALRINGSTLGQELFAVDGTNGRLFTVTDDLSDSLYSVNTIAGLPVLEVFANNVVTIGKFGTNAIYVGQDGRVGFGTTNFSYTASDTSGATGSPSNNRVFVNGSIQLLNGSDAFVTGRSGASFFKDEEIAFGWGGGWFMEDATYLRVRGNKMVYSGGSARFDDSLYLGGQTYRFYSANSGTWTNGNFGAEGDIYFGTRGTWLSTYLNQAVRTDSSPTFQDVYADNWFRNNGSNEGLYNQVTTQHWSSNTNGYWDASSTTSVSSIRFYTGGHMSSLRGYVYANSSNEIGFLNSAGNWGLRMDNSYNVQIYGTITATNFSGSSSGTNTGDQTNISGNAATATNVAWTGVTGRPTALSSFTNDLGNYGGFLTSLPSHNHDDRYYTESESDSRFINESGDTMSGRLTLKSISGVEQTVPNEYGAYLHLGSWGVGRTDATAVLVNTAYRADYATDLFDMNISRFTNNSGYITTNGRAYPRNASGGDINFYWSGQSGQPTWLWGGTDGTNMYVYNPSNFSVNYAASAGAVAWTNVTSRPTALSSFTNDLGNYGGFLTSLPSHNHDGVYVPINPDGDGPSWSYSDNNPTINGKYVGGGQRFGADGSVDSGFLQAKHLNAYDGHVNSSDGYYVGVIEYGSIPGVYDTTQVIDSSGRWTGVAIADAKIASSANWNTAYGWGNHAGLYASSSHTHTFASLTSKPTTISGYGITDAITTGNIGSQSVNYASSAGSVAWTNVSGRPTALSQFTNDLGLGGAAVTIQDSAPAGTAGKLWWESDTGKLKVYYGSAWVDASPIPDMSLYYSKAGGSINGDVTVSQTLTVVGNTLIQGVLTETSDISLKENILPLENSLDKVMKLNGVSFNKKATPNMQEIGFIAQEVEAIIPDLVTETGEGIKTVSYSRVTAVLVETIKEQQTQINELKEMVNILTKKLDNL